MDAFDRIVGPAEPQAAKTQRQELPFEAMLRARLSHDDNAGHKVAAVRRAYQTARDEWAGLPSIVFDEIVESWTFHLYSEAAEEAQATGDEPEGLADFIEGWLAGQVHGHLTFQWRGAKFQVAAQTSIGRRTLTALYEQGQRIASEYRAALLQLWQAVPTSVSEAEAHEAFTVMFHEEAR